MILVNYKEYYADHDCWGSCTTGRWIKWGEFKSMDDWLKFRKGNGDVEFIKAYVVTEVIE